MSALVLEKQSLSGLNVLFRDASDQGYHRGSIQLYDGQHDCFIVCSGQNSQHHAIQFKQFSVEQDAGQLVLKVPACTYQPLPELYAGPGGLQPQASGQSSQRESSTSSAAPQPSGQLSAVLSQQLSGLIGRCFSHTDEGFEAEDAAQQQQQEQQVPQTADGSTKQQVPQQQGLAMQVRRPSRHSIDSTPDDSSYWGSPVKQDGSTTHGTAVGTLAAAAAAGGGGGAATAAHTSSVGRGPPCNTAGELPVLQSEPMLNNHQLPAASTPPPAAAAAGAGAGAAGAPGVSFSSFQEISRMISHSEDSSPLGRPSSIKTSMPPGLASRLLDEQGSWGTPHENSPWGTPREPQQGSNASNTPTSSGHEQPGPQHLQPPHSGYAVHKLMFGGEQLHSRLDAVEPSQHSPLQVQQHGSSLAAEAVAPPADILGASKLQVPKPAGAAGQPEAASRLEPAAVVAAAVAAVDAAAADTEADSFRDLDFTIPVAMDVQPRPHSRGSSRTRDMYRAGSSSSNTGLVVDVPQPLSSRHAGLLRSPGRSLPAPSDPGSATATGSAFSYAANMAAAQVSSASAGGAAGFEQQRRMGAAASTHTGLGSLGGSQAASRRISRNASSRLNADQDWALLGPDGQSLQQQLAAMQTPQQRTSLGQVLHAPGAASRRASRTLSGRLALDQDLAAVLMEELDDAEPDVLSRPLAPAAHGLDTIISRRQSTSNGRGTPDSDGFGFSEFEGLEPLVPPEEAAAAALTEAAAAAAVAAESALADSNNSSALAGHTHSHQQHHRAHRRSARSLGVAPGASVPQRTSMRLSDQDPGHHGLAALPAMTAAAVAAAAAARAHASAAAGAPVPRTTSYDVVGAPPTAQQGEESVAEAPRISAEGPAAAAAPPPSATASLSRVDSRSNSAGPTAAGSRGSSPSTRSGPGSLNDSRRSSKRSIPSIFQAAAAVAAAAEAAAAAAVGYARGGRDRASSEAQAAGEADGAAEQQDPCEADGEPLQGTSSFAGSSFLKQRLAPDSMGSVDSFTCPPFMPLSGSITATGGESRLAGVSSSGSQLGAAVPADSSAVEPVPSTLLPPTAAGGEAEAAVGIHVPSSAAAATAVDSYAHIPGMYGSPSALSNSFPTASGSPSAAAAALLRRQQLMSSEGSEWGSGTMGSGPLLHLSTSGIDSPTGSAVFRLGGNSPHPLDTCDSAGGGSVSVAAGELSAALESLAVQAAGGTGGLKSVGIGASRMAREAAAAAGSFSSGAAAAGPMGAAALMIGTQGAVGGLHKGAVPGLSEITPADDDADDPGEARIQAKYPSDSGENPAAGAVFFRLAGGCATGAGPGEQTSSPAQPVAGHAAMKRSSSGGGSAAVSKVLGKIMTGKASLLAKPAVPDTERDGSSNNSSCRRPGLAQVIRSRDDSSSSNSEASPPSYAESVGVQAGDESSSSMSAVRQAAALGRASQTAGVGAVQSEQEEEQGGITSIQQPSTTGLIRRTPHASRTPSQSLPAGLRPTIEGFGLLGAQQCGDDESDNQPLMRAGAGASADQGVGVLPEARSQVGRVVLHTFLTLSAQWFDAMALVVLGPQLASAMPPPAHTAQLQQGASLQRLFSVFALGHVLWPLGCFWWPRQAAKLGRKPLLMWTVGLSGICTALVGCMPSYIEGGMVGMRIITALRILSGAAHGNTAAAALAYLTEHAPQCPSLHASVVPASMAAGAFGASVVALLLSWVMSPAVLAASGWRVVLVLSLFCNSVTGGLRGYVLHEPEGTMQTAELSDRRNAHVAHILRRYFPELVLAVLLQAFAATGLFLLTAWLPSYFMQLTGMVPATALLIHTINMAALAGSMPLGGLLADEWESTSVLLGTCVTATAFAYPAWLLFSLGVAEVTWFAQFCLCVLVGLHWGALTQPLADLFPLQMRSSALTVAHVVPMLALGSTAPLMAIRFIGDTGNLAAPAYINIIMAALTAAVVTWQSLKGRGGVLHH